MWFSQQVPDDGVISFRLALCREDIGSEPCSLDEIVDTR